MLRQRVLLVHGAGSFGAAAWPKQHGLALDYDALFLRRHGYGAGPVPPDLEADIALIRGELREGGHLVAHSTGAVPAMLAALRYPGMVSSLVLCEPAVFSLTRDLPVTTAHRKLLQPHSGAAPEWDAPLDIVPGVPTLVLTGGWEPLYEEVAEFLVSTGAEHLQVGGNHRPQDTDAGARAIRAFLARRKPDSR